VAAACGDDDTPQAPALPPGFADARLADVPLDLFVFASPEEPFALPTAYFLGADPPAAALLPDFFEAVEATTWIGPTAGSFGSTIRFAVVEEATAIGSYLEAGDAPWHVVEGEVLTLVRGDSVWARQAQQAVQLDLQATLQEKYPDIWALMQALPSEPPVPPVAAGFLRLNGDLIASLGEQVGASGDGITAALGTARVKDMAFALYQETAPDLPGSLDADYMLDTGTVALVVTESGYPGFVVGRGMGVFAGQAGMEEITLGDTQAYYVGWGRLHIVLRNRGATLFVALAAERERAESLMATVPE
jgi:hypothetical protein